MAKYSYEFKRMVVQEYLDGEGGYESLTKKHGIQKQLTMLQKNK